MTGMWQPELSLPLAIRKHLQNVCSLRISPMNGGFRAICSGIVQTKFFILSESGSYVGVAECLINHHLLSRLAAQTFEKEKRTRQA